MRQEQQRLALARAAVTRNEISLARVWTYNPDVGVGKARRLQPNGHRGSGFGGVAIGIGSIDLDQLPIDVTRKLVLRVIVGQSRKEK